MWRYFSITYQIDELINLKKIFSKKKKKVTKDDVSLFYALLKGHVLLLYALFDLRIQLL